MGQMSYSSLLRPSITESVSSKPKPLPEQTQEQNEVKQARSSQGPLHVSTTFGADRAQQQMWPFLVIRTSSPSCVNGVYISQENQPQRYVHNKKEIYIFTTDVWFNNKWVIAMKQFDGRVVILYENISPLIFCWASVNPDSQLPPQVGWRPLLEWLPKSIALDRFKMG